MKSLISVCFMLSVLAVLGQTHLDADGPGETYELISNVLAPGHNPVEVPDCSHADFDRHIDELFDEELGSHVFRFFMHVSPDNDRCKNFDRQRNEIKTYDKSPDELLGVAGETVLYQWKFKLDEDFQASPNFSHIHQLKSVGGSLESMPMYTLTARKGSPDQLELRYAETDKQITLLKTDLTPFKGAWVEVSETIAYGVSGSYEIEIRRISDDQLLLNYSNGAIVNWRPEAEFVRPKWGLYRSLINAQDLRDEEVLFANFLIEELVTLSVFNSDADYKGVKIFPNPAAGVLQIKNVPDEAEILKIFSMDGTMVLHRSIGFENDLDLDVSSLSKGTYYVYISGSNVNQAKLIFIL
ncbi:T9SS type A sorting domain-containing protein [Lutimonas sp.]|uniref:T9SS type A sorting domain-containing protein n=1 Tax=Lutimonas sp. TaxID=1872403 RepID=UPI003D9BE021